MQREAGTSESDICTPGSRRSSQPFVLRRALTAVSFLLYCTTRQLLRKENMVPYTAVGMTAGYVASLEMVAPVAKYRLKPSNNRTKFALFMYPVVLTSTHQCKLYALATFTRKYFSQSPYTIFYQIVELAVEHILCNCSHGVYGGKYRVNDCLM